MYKRLQQIVSPKHHVRLHQKSYVKMLMPEAPVINVEYKAPNAPLNAPSALEPQMDYTTDLEHVIKRGTKCTAE